MVKSVFEVMPGETPFDVPSASDLADASSFDDFALIFNGNVVSRAKAVVCPLDAQDVSR